MLIEIGGGLDVRDGWTNLDPVHGVGPWRRPAQTHWPCPPCSVGHVRASHVLEHIPAGDARICVMNEAWRVLVPGGTFEVIVPLFPSEEAIGDPTHVSFWVERSFAYFTGAVTAAADYGILLWEQLDYEVRGGWEARWLAQPAGK